MSIAGTKEELTESQALDEVIRAIGDSGNSGSTDVEYIAEMFLDIAERVDQGEVREGDHLLLEMYNLLGVNNTIDSLYLRTVAAALVA